MSLLQNATSSNSAMGIHDNMQIYYISLLIDKDILLLIKNISKIMKRFLSIMINLIS